jgi:hypothetical protein
LTPSKKLFTGGLQMFLQLTISFLLMLLTLPNAFASTEIRLESKQAGALFDSLPTELKEVHPGSLVRRADRIVCIISTPEETSRLYKCTISKDNSSILLTEAPAQSLFDSLPEQLRKISQDTVYKITLETYCSSSPGRGLGPNYLCSIFTND